ncbi:MAG: phosphatase PAP2 family protein [Actinomycetota bacterium]|nr:phosphatase PAP2 family protein [Actinomycetota bacterium]
MLYAVRKRTGMPMAVTLPLVSVTPMAVAAAVPPGRWRYIATGAAYMWVFKVTWELPADNPTKLRERLRIDYPIQVDTVLGVGVPPTLRLQRWLRDPPRVTVLDRVVTVIYGSWFLPHLLLAWIWLHHKQYLPRAAGRLSASYQLTTPFYWLLPTAPPWWASESANRMDGEVERVLRHVIRDARGKPRVTTDNTPGNPWGSMPSDHISSAAITAMGLSEVGTVYGVIGWTYVALASFAVVYLGEHYLIDVIAGLVVAETIRLAEPAVNPLVRLVAVNLERLAS